MPTPTRGSVTVHKGIVVGVAGRTATVDVAGQLYELPYVNRPPDGEAFVVFAGRTGLVLGPVAGPVIVQPTGETHYNIFGTPGVFTNLVDVGATRPVNYTDGSTSSYVRVSGSNNYVPEIYGRFPATQLPAGGSASFTATLRQWDAPTLSWPTGGLAPVPWDQTPEVLGSVASLTWPLTAAPDYYADLLFDASQITTDWQTITGTIQPISPYTMADVEALIQSGQAWWTYFFHYAGYDPQTNPRELTVDLADIRLIWEP